MGGHFLVIQLCSMSDFSNQQARQLGRLGKEVLVLGIEDSQGTYKTVRRKVL